MNGLIPSNQPIMGHLCRLHPFRRQWQQPWKRASRAFPCPVRRLGTGEIGETASDAETGGKKQKMNGEESWRSTYFRHQNLIILAPRQRRSWVGMPRAMGELGLWVKVLRLDVVPASELVSYSIQMDTNTIYYNHMFFFFIVYIITHEVCNMLDSFFALKLSIFCWTSGW